MEIRQRDASRVRPPSVTSEDPLVFESVQSSIDSAVRAGVAWLYDRASRQLGRALERAGRVSIWDASDAHWDAVARTGLGRYYGVKSTFAKMPEDARTKWLADWPDAPPPEAMDCMRWALRHLSSAYEEAGASERWRAIEDGLRAPEDPRQHMRATDLARALQDDGWEAIYFAPDTAEILGRAKRDEHWASARLILKQGRAYYGLEIRDTILNYRAEPAAEEGLRKLRGVGFYFGFAKGGRHAFVGYNGSISEAHWSENPDSANVIGTLPLERFPWRSGVIMVPPGAWPTSLRRSRP